MLAVHQPSLLAHAPAMPRLALAVRSFADAVGAECVFIVAVAATGEARCVACHPPEMRPRVDAIIAEGRLAAADDELLWRPVHAAEGGGALGWVGVVPGDTTVNETTLQALLTLAAELAAMDLARAGERGRGA